MKAVNLVALTLAVVLFVSWISVAFYPSIRDFMDANPFWNGLRDFDSRFGAESIDDLNEVTSRTEGDVLVAIAYLPYQPQELDKVADFVAGGGTLLLMDDYGYGNQVLERLGLDMSFDGDPLLDPYLTYRNQWLPLATDVADRLRETGVQQLAMDRATGLHVSGPYEVLARSSDTSYLDRDASGSWDADEPKGPFAVAAQVSSGRGKVIAVSDPSILINSMVNRADNSLFLEQVILSDRQNPRIYVDTSHLPKAPLDRAKQAWQVARQRMGAPYAQILLVGAVLAIAWVPFRSKGGKIERKR